MQRPITLVTDFGDDIHQAEVIGAADRACLGACDKPADVLHPTVKDVCKWSTIGPEYTTRMSIVHGSYNVRQMVRTWAHRNPVGIVVVDPFVGADENKNIVVQTERGGTLIGPNNGVFHQTIEEFGLVEAVEIDEEHRTKPKNDTSSFNGRDLFGPVAGEISAGATPSSFGQPLSKTELVDPNIVPGTVLTLDDFGNAKIHAFDPFGAESNGHVEIRVGDSVHNPKRVRNHNEATQGELIALRGSSNTGELWVAWGSARESLKLRIGDVVEFDEQFAQKTA